MNPVIAEWRKIGQEIGPALPGLCVASVLAALSLGLIMAFDLGTVV